MHGFLNVKGDEEKEAEFKRHKEDCFMYGGVKTNTLTKRQSNTQKSQSSHHSQLAYLQTLKVLLGKMEFINQLDMLLLLFLAIENLSFSDTQEVMHVHIS